MKPLRLILAVLALALLAFAETQHGAAIREMTVYLSPDTGSQRIGNVPRGRDIAILETSPGWVHVFVTTDQGKDISGWMEDKGVVRASTPNADRVLFGAAADSEAEAEKPHGRKGAAIDAGRLYMRISDFFPTSPLAGEALYRAADIKWQIDSIDVWTLPSAKTEDPALRPKIDDEMMKQVKKKFPGTKWAELADFAMLDNKICGDWQAQSKCPEKEAELYTKYADEHPKSPKAAEALYDAAWRQSALVSIYKTEGDEGKSSSAKQKAIALTQRLTSGFPDTDWATRATLLQYMVQQGIPTYGSPTD